MLLTIEVEHKFGAINEDGTIVIPPRFEELGSFHDGRARYRRGAEWGYIDESGNSAVEPRFEEADMFSNGVAFVKFKGLYGLINRAGEWISTPRFTSVREFADGLALVQESNTSPFGYISLDGLYVIPPKFRPYADSFSGGYAVIGQEIGGKLLFGFITKTGEFAIAPRYLQAHPFAEKLAAVSHHGRGRIGFIDEKENIVIEHDFDGTMMRFSEGLCSVWQKPGCGYINRSGKLAIGYQFPTADPFTDGLGLVSTRSKKGQYRLGYIGPDGQWVLDARFVAAEPFKSGVAHVSVDGERWGYIAKSGDYLWEPSC